MCELRCPWGPEENVKPLGAGVQGKCELLGIMGAGNGTWVLCKSLINF